MKRQETQLRNLTNPIRIIGVSIPNRSNEVEGISGGGWAGEARPTTPILMLLQLSYNEKNPNAGLGFFYDILATKVLLALFAFLAFLRFFLAFILVRHGILLAER